MRIFLLTLLLMFFLSNSFIVNDEMLIALQVHGITSGFTVNPEKLISYQGTPWFSFNGKSYAPFSYLLPILAYPIYLLLLFLNTYFYPDILFFLIPSAILLLLFTNRRVLLLTAAFILANIILFKPIYLFEDWAALYSLKLVNVIAISITASIIYALLKEEFGEVARAGVLIFLFATPVAYWALTAKSHALSLMFISAAIYHLKKENIPVASAMAGLAVWARPLDGIATIASIILFLRDKRILHAIPGFAAGYLPCALFGYLLFGIPMPVEIIGNMFSNVSYVKPAFDPSILPSIFFGVNNRTLGMVSYSPILAILTSPIYTQIPIQFRKTAETVKMAAFERFLLIFILITFLIYLPFLQSGVVETGVRDYRFYLPLYIPLTYFICKRIWGRGAKIKLENFAFTITIFSVISVILFSLLNTLAGYAVYVYLCISAVLIVLFIFFDRLKNETTSEILPLSTIPVIFLISDQLLGYFSPYDIHFCLPLLDRFVELLIWLKNF